ncbi:hypothetical protein BCR36DRAFT_371447 [Piromyces finnis]|uniref:Uncharacterized protein n=1 Tax=Piromyces finnis TaxID=1754191 RepID=A0A1Y1V5G7_9FUNG|nr:hypothetical protein BCR36DRAFT_371447 [Piromyces finnis]|eukprot:ORX47807.1 hypothetical protein BCR36DRAFT_371447 [Piromyces finnis]
MNKNIQLIYFVFFNRNVLVMDENKRAMITLLALDYVPFNMFSAFFIYIYILFHYALSFLYILAAVILDTRKIFQSKVLFPIFTQIIFKAIIPKDQKLAAYPTIPYLTGDMLL